MIGEKKGKHTGYAEYSKIAYNSIKLYIENLEYILPDISKKLEEEFKKYENSVIKVHKINPRYEAEESNKINKDKQENIFIKSIKKYFSPTADFEILLKIQDFIGINVFKIARKLIYNKEGHDICSERKKLTTKLNAREEKMLNKKEFKKYVKLLNKIIFSDCYNLSYYLNTIKYREDIKNFFTFIDNLKRLSEHLMSSINKELKVNIDVSIVKGEQENLIKNIEKIKQISPREINFLDIIKNKDNNEISFSDDEIKRVQRAFNNYLNNITNKIADTIEKKFGISNINKDILERLDSVFIENMFYRLYDIILPYSNQYKDNMEKRNKTYLNSKFSDSNNTIEISPEDLDKLLEKIRETGSLLPLKNFLDEYNNKQ